MRFFILSALLCLLSMSDLHATPADSIGLEKVDGRVYVLHQVEQKETLYSLSRRYGVKIGDITGANPDAENGLSIGQILRIPYEKPVVNQDGRIVHTVQPKETLYSIARDYEVDVEAIKKWNGMSMNLLDIGQKLIIYPRDKQEAVVVTERNTREVVNFQRHTVKAGETLYSISRKYNASLENLRDWNELEYNDISIGMELIVGKTSETVTPAAATSPVVQNMPGERQDATPVVMAETPQERDEPAQVSGNSDTATAASEVVYNMEKDRPFERENTNYEEVEEDGNAELIDGSGNNRKYLALHRTAPIGTIMRVRNEMNDQEVFVRIIGRLPDTGANRNVLLKISKAAYEQLGAIDNRFRVRVSYIP